MRVLGVLSGKPIFINIKIPCLQIHITVFAVLVTLKSVLFSFNRVQVSYSLYLLKHNTFKHTLTDVQAERLK